MGLENLLLGFSIAVTPFNLFVAVVGITLGTIIGVLPGLGGANGVAILLPLTFTMPPTSAIILLTSLYWGALFGGAITSILFNIPGEPWSGATTFDGYPMARQGRSGQALTAAFTSSFVGAFFSIVLITFFAPILAEVALKFGPPEFFAIQLLTFSSFVGLGGGNPLKSLVSILIGFILAAIGLDIVTGQLRMTFGFTDLMKGFDFIVAVIGLFGIGEILLSVEEGLTFKGTRTGMNLRVVLDTWKVLPRYYRTFVRGSFIGFWMGFKPGGATPASFMSYAFAKRFSKHPERFGKGELEGVVAPETAAHAAGVAAMLPMITLGIPGSPTAAVMLGGLIIWGLQPGPLLFTEKPDFVWGLIASMYTGNIIGVVMVLAFVPFFAAILRIPFAILTPVIVVVCALGSYAVHNSMIDIWYMVIFGVVGYVFKKLDYPLAPLVLALVLGDLAENALRQSLIMSQGSLAIFMTRPISGAITAVAVVLRLVFVAIVSLLLRVPLLQLLGGLLLLWIAVRLVRPDTGDAGSGRHGGSLWEAIWIIIVADVTMSLDNVLAIAAASHGDLVLVMFGIGLSLPIVVWGAGLLAHLMNRFAWIVWLGGGVLGYVAGEMFMEDPIVKRGLGETASALHYPVPVVVGLVITASGWWFARGHRHRVRVPGNL